VVTLKLSHYTPRSACGEGKYSFYSFTTSALDVGEWSAERTPGTHCTGSWVGPRAGMDTEVSIKILSHLLGIEPRSPGRPARSQTLFWPSYTYNKMDNTDFCMLHKSNVLLSTFFQSVHQVLVLPQRTNVVSLSHDSRGQINTYWEEWHSALSFMHSSLYQHSFPP
jgi:hypothetical protein